MEDNKKQEIKIFKALSDINRLIILEQFIGKRKCNCKLHSSLENEVCTCDLLATLKISQPTLSHHMKVLREAEIIKCRKDGKCQYYSIDDIGISYIKNFVNRYK